MSKRIKLITIDEVRGYVDENNMAWCNVEDIAKGLGFTDTHEIENFATSCEKDFSTINRKYTNVRWKTVNKYLYEFGYDKEVNKDSYIPENMVYRLAMKAKSKIAKQFQAKLAYEILPSIRKNGIYIDPTHDKILKFADSIRYLKLKNINELIRYSQLENYDYNRILYITQDLIEDICNIKDGIKPNSTQLYLNSLFELLVIIIIREYIENGNYSTSYIINIMEEYIKGLVYYIKENIFDDNNAKIKYILDKDNKIKYTISQEKGELKENKDEKIESVMDWNSINIIDKYKI